MLIGEHLENMDKNNKKYNPQSQYHGFSAVNIVMNFLSPTLYRVVHVRKFE